MTKDVLITAHTITRVYEDGSTGDYKVKLDEDSIWIEHGESWVSLPLTIMEPLNDAISSLLATSKKR